MNRAVTFDFTGRVAFVTGGSSGIGKAIATMLARSGASVAVADIDSEAARTVVQALVEEGGAAIALPVDVRSQESCDDAVQTTVGRLGGLDMAVNSAGVLGAGASFGDYPPSEWRRLMSVNLDGIFHSMASEYRAMRQSGGGSIVNIASVMGVVATAPQPAYAASKHGVIGITKSAALDGAQHGIRVNAVGPGFVETTFQDHMQPERKREFAERHAMKRFGLPEEVAGLVCWLLSDQASFVTGSFHPVDGGYTAM